MPDMGVEEDDEEEEEAAGEDDDNVTDEGSRAEGEGEGDKEDDEEEEDEEDEEGEDEAVLDLRDSARTVRVNSVLRCCANSLSRSQSKGSFRAAR